MGVIVHDLDDQERKAAYEAATSPTAPTTNSASITCATTAKFRISDCVQREHFFGIVDEVDSILIDEARTPLIISGPSEELDRQILTRSNRIIPFLDPR